MSEEEKKDSWEEWKRQQEVSNFRARQREKEELIKTARIPPIFRRRRAEDFKTTKYNHETAELAIRAITENIGLYIYGECGTGKTLLTSIIANERAERLRETLFIRAVDIYFELNPFCNEEPRLLTRKMAILQNTPCLIIDDLGVEKPSQFTKTTLFNIIDHRYQNNLQTIINSNFPLEELKKIVDGYEGGRVIRRIKAICEITELKHF